MEVSAFLATDLLLTAIAALVWARHGYPGLSVVLSGRRPTAVDPKEPADPDAVDDE